MTRYQVSTGLLAISLILMAWGSFRDAITPVGYWLVWLLWAVAVLNYLRRGSSRWNLPPIWVVASFGTLIAGMVISGLFNSDPTTLYQAAKITVIGGFFIVMWQLVVRADSRQLVDALYGAIAVLVLGFFISKLIPSASFTLGGGREGYILAMPGVIWKAGVFFLPILLADLIARPWRWVPGSLAIAACVFLALVDRSRTGLLMIIGAFACLCVVLWWRREWYLLLQRPRWLLLAAACLVGLLLLDTGINAYKAPPASGGSGGGVAAIVGEAMDPLLESRLGAGDEPRMEMLRNGLAQSGACFPLGCGFGSTAFDAGYGIPMNVHNAYLGALADFGLIGLLGMLGFIAASVRPMRVLRRSDAERRRVYFILGTAGSALAYCLALMLHTFTSEMSEWGYLLIMLAFAWSPSWNQSGGAPNDA